MEFDELEGHHGSPGRRTEEAKLTRLMETLSPFTYPRLGDGELGLLIEWQQGQTPKSTMDRTASFRRIWCDWTKARRLPQADESL